jgi:protein ImuB
MRDLRHPYNNKQGSRFYLCAYFPEWSIDVTRRKLRAQNPQQNPLAILLTTQHAQHLVVARACYNAQRAGVRPMMPLPVARALTPEDHTYSEPFDPIRDADALTNLTVWCLKFSPLVGLDTELHKAKLQNELSTLSSLHYGITIDLTGTERIHKDLTTFSHTIHNTFKNTARVALAPTIGGAWALSRTGQTSPSVALSLPALKDAVYELPVYALRIDRAVVTLLHDVGIYTIGQLLELPRHSLASRFGKHTVYRLSQLLGAIEERFYTVTPTKRYIQQKVFEPPLVHRRAITLAIEHLFTTLLQSLKRDHATAQLFSLTLTDTGSNTIRKELPLASASNDPCHLAAIMQPIIDSLNFCGELREILLEAHNIVSTHQQQHSFTSDTQYDSHVIQRSYNELLNSFTVRIGKDRITRAHCTHSHIPENSFSYRSALDEKTPHRHAYTIHQPPVVYGLRERPPVLFATPEPITTIAMLPDKPPSWIRWRNTTLSIISGMGPERIAPEWWRGDLQRDTFSERDYFTIQDTSGRWLWVFREQRNQAWFIHGVWT